MGHWIKASAQTNTPAAIAPLGKALFIDWIEIYGRRVLFWTLWMEEKLFLPGIEPHRRYTD
jgi:hypothetical protein